MVDEAAKSVENMCVVVVSQLPLCLVVRKGKLVDKFCPHRDLKLIKHKHCHTAQDIVTQLSFDIGNLIGLVKQLCIFQFLLNLFKL